MSPLDRHQEQFKRVQRWYERFKSINNGIIHNKASEFYEDEMYAFFMNCYHLKDWIINDPATVLVANKVEKYINNNLDLKLCADLCNSLKHLCSGKNIRPTRSKEDPNIGKKSGKLNIGAGPIIFEMKIIINTLSGPRDAFDIATKCMEAWDKFYSDNKLNVTGSFDSSIIR